MEFSDYLKMMLRSRTNYNLVTVTQNANTLLTQPNMKRLALRIIPFGGTGAMYISDRRMTAVSQGFQISNAGNNPAHIFAMNRLLDGYSVCGEWHAFTASTNVFFLMMETVMADQDYEKMQRFLAED